ADEAGHLRRQISFASGKRHAQTLVQTRELLHLVFAVVESNATPEGRQRSARKQVCIGSSVGPAPLAAVLPLLAHVSLQPFGSGRCHNTGGRLIRRSPSMSQASMHKLQICLSWWRIWVRGAELNRRIFLQAFRELIDDLGNRRDDP